MTTYYLHTLDGKPAEFSPEHKCIFFITRHGSAGRLARSLRQIRREQQIDIRNNPNSSKNLDYGYCRVSVPDGDKQDTL